MKILIIILVFLGILFLAGGGYFLGLQNGQSQVESTAVPVAATTPSPAVESSVLPSPSPSPSPDTKTLIEDAFKSGSFDNLKSQLASRIHIIAYGTECCGDTEDLNEVIDFVSGYEEKAEGWEVDPEDSKYEGIDGYDVIAVSKDGRLLGFVLDENGKVEKVQFFVDYKLAK